MHGAREYSYLFTSGQYGRFYIDSSSHARGRTFQIFLLPEGMTLSKGQTVNKFSPDVVEIFGMLGGDLGWTYGWIHHGKWVDDFQKFVDEKLEKKKIQTELDEKVKKQKEEDSKNKIKSLLESY